MFARLLSAGHSIVYTPRALVWHRHRDTDAELRACIFGYGVGVYAFLTKRVIEERDVNAVTVAARWLIGPFVRAARQRLTSTTPVSLQLLLLEAAGAALGPVRFMRSARTIRAPRHQSR